MNDGTWSYTWKHGRQLATMSNGSTTWTYTYDANGLRTKRTNGTTTYEYVYNGNQLVQMKCGSVTMKFFYDGNGRPYAMLYNTTIFYYILNQQGDVVRIVNQDGTGYGGYTYDAWGNPLSVPNNEVAQNNPLRYRGYVWDKDTGLYYLQSRYYNPEWGRFLNSDRVYDLDAGLQGYNLFVYCGNNPINRIDISGTDSAELDDLDAVEPELSERGGSGSGFSCGGGYANAYNPIDAGYHYSIDMSQAANSSSFSGGLFSNGYSAYEQHGGEKTEIHHIVEQCQQAKSGFSAADIQSPGNKIAIPYSVHRKISGFYSSKPEWTKGLRVRDWLAGQSFEQQSAYGWMTVDRYMRG